MNECVCAHVFVCVGTGVSVRMHMYIHCEWVCAHAQVCCVWMGEGVKACAHNCVHLCRAQTVDTVS